MFQSSALQIVQYKSLPIFKLPKSHKSASDQFFGETLQCVGVGFSYKFKTSDPITKERKVYPSCATRGPSLHMPWHVYKVMI